jgi:raffinose/stachyose/melibiose transport system substrate-binding protein
MSTQQISRRRMLKLAALGATGTLLAACGGAPTASAPAPTAASAAQAPAASTGAQGKLVIMSAGNADQNAPLVKAIEEAHPGVQVEWRFLPSERYVELFTASEVAGDQIDIMDLNGQDLRRYAVGGKLIDISDISFKDRFQDLALNTYTIKGKLWALPRGGISGFTFLYNKKALAKIGVTKEPETYDEVLAMTPDLRKAGIAPFAHPGKNIYLWPVWQFWAHAQTSGNQSIDHTFKTLNGQMKFTDPEQVAALEILYRYAQDKQFIESVNSLDSDGAWLAFSQGKAAFLYDHTWHIGQYRTDASKYPDLDLSLIPPLRSVSDPNVKRQMPGGTGSALGIYAKIAPERLDLARSTIDLLTSDKWVKWSNDLIKDPVSCNKNVQASDDPLALKYAKECAPNQTIYLDWYWPPEITRAFQENQQALVTGDKKPDEAAQSIQKALDGLVKDGYKFEI